MAATYFDFENTVRHPRKQEKAEENGLALDHKSGM